MSLRGESPTAPGHGSCSFYDECQQDERRSVTHFGETTREFSPNERVFLPQDTSVSSEGTVVLVKTRNSDIGAEDKVSSKKTKRVNAPRRELGPHFPL